MSNRNKGSIDVDVDSEEKATSLKELLSNIKFVDARKAILAEEAKKRKGKKK